MGNNRITYLTVVLLALSWQLGEGADVVCSSSEPSSCTINQFPTLTEGESVNIIHTNPESVVTLTISNVKTVTKLHESFFTTFPNLEHFTLTKTSVSRINRNDLKNAKNVKVFEFNANQIEDIDDFSFTGLDKVTKINVVANKLRVIRRDTFEGLVNIKELTLGYNPIETIEAGAFNLPQLEILSMERVKLTSISRNIFRVPSPLKHFYLTHSGVTKIGGFFDGTEWNELELVDLSENPFTDWTFTMFAKLPKLKTIYVPRTQFKTATEEDVATAESAGSKLDGIMLSEEQVSREFLAAIHRVFKSLTQLYIGRDENQEKQFSDEEILKVIPGVTLTRFENE